jgi:plasmid stabilization system protein ParE
MSRRILVEPEAEAELQAAAEWYEAQRAGLGFELLVQAQASYQRIAEGEHGANVPGAQTGARRVPVARFPLWIVFIERSEAVVIVAYAHERRRPGYWLTRVRKS